MACLLPPFKTSSALPPPAAGGLSGGVTEDQLRALFAPYGDIVYVKIPPGKGCGFVQYVQRSAAEQAMQVMQVGRALQSADWFGTEGDCSSLWPAEDFASGASRAARV